MGPKRGLGLDGRRTRGGRSGFRKGGSCWKELKAETRCVWCGQRSSLGCRATSSDGGQVCKVMVWHLPGPGWPNNMARVTSSRTEMRPGSQRLTPLETTSRKRRGEKNNAKKRFLCVSDRSGLPLNSVSSLHPHLHQARKYLQASSESSLASGVAMEASNFLGALMNQDI